MILVTGTNDRQIAEVRRALLHVGLISERVTLSSLCLRLSERSDVYTVLHILEKRRPALEGVTFLAKRLFPRTLHGVLLLEECDAAFLRRDAFSFVLPFGVKPKRLAEAIVLSCISKAQTNPSEVMAGALCYRLFEKEFSMVLKHFSFSDTHTALLLALMEAYPHGLSQNALMRIAFLPLGLRSRSNVSHAVLSINRRFFEAGLARNGAPLICFDRAKGYFLRS